MKFDDILSDDNILKASGLISAVPAIGHIALHKPFGKVSRKFLNEQNIRTSEERLNLTRTISTSAKYLPESL